jgi:hypothetical protein
MNNKNDSQLWKYAGLATQFFVAIGIAVYAGVKLDGWLKFKIPLAVWILPLLIIVAMIVKIIKDTTPKK